MKTYTIEVAGRAIAVFSADDDTEAEDWVNHEILRTDLMILEGPDGRPLWDGKAEIGLRDANPDEHAVWRASNDRALRSGHVEKSEMWQVFLVPVRDPTDDETDEG